MPALSSLRDSWLGTSVSMLLTRFAALELLDRAYILAAQAFVAVFPLLLGIAAVVVAEGHESAIAEDLIDRMGLVGAGAAAMRELIVVRPGGVYWLGLVIVAYSAFSLSRRLGRVYNAIWATRPLPAREQWRGLVWIVLQVTLIVAVTELRDIIGESGPLLGGLVALVVLVVWFGGEYLVQRLFTRGAVAASRLLLAAALVTVGRLGIVIWGAWYLADSASRQAFAFGPIGLVFGLFTSLFATCLVILCGTLIAAVLTEPDGTSGRSATSTARVTNEDH